MSADTPETNAALIDIGHPLQGPSTVPSEKEDEDLLLEIIESLKEGAEERKIVEAIVFSGARKRVEVLDDTGMNEKEYEAAKKRLRRFLENYRQERATAHQ